MAWHSIPPRFMGAAFGSNGGNMGSHTQQFVHRQDTQAPPLRYSTSFQVVLLITPNQPDPQWPCGISAAKSPSALLWRC